MSESVELSLEKGRKFITCCENKNEHIVYEPVEFPCCGLNACRKCIENSFITFCRICQRPYGEKELLCQTVNKSAYEFIEDNLTELFEELKEKQPRKDVEELTRAMLGEKIKNIEENIDLRVKSLKSEIDKYSENYKSKLKDFNDYAN